MRVVMDALRIISQKTQDTNLICAPVIAQHAAVAAIKAGRHYCAPYIQRLAETRQQLLRLLAHHSLRMVAPLPGSTFGVEGQCCFRISYGALDAPSVLEGVRRLIEGVKS